MGAPRRSNFRGSARHRKLRRELRASAVQREAGRIESAECPLEHRFSASARERRYKPQHEVPGLGAPVLLIRAVVPLPWIWSDGYPTDAGAHGPFGNIANHADAS